MGSSARKLVVEDSKFADSDIAANLFLATAGVGMDILCSSASGSVVPTFPFGVSAFPLLWRGGDEPLRLSLQDSAG